MLKYKNIVLHLSHHIYKQIIYYEAKKNLIQKIDLNGNNK